MGSPLRQRLGLTKRNDAAFLAITDREVMGRALMYLLLAIGTAVVASVAIPNAPLHDEHAVPVLAAIAYAAAIGVFFGFDRLPAWAVHAVLFGVTALISWAVYASDDAGSPYKIFFVWVALYAAFFLSPIGAGIQVAGMLIGYGVALILIDNPATPALNWVLTASALVLLAVAIQALALRVARLVETLTEMGRTDSVTGLLHANAFSESLENEVERARRSGNRLAVVIGELGDFTPAGKGGSLSPAQRQLLSSVGAIFKESPRQIDLAARISDGRFGMVLPYTDEHGAYLLAERIRGRVAALDGGRAHMSFGIAGFPRAGANADVVRQSAQTALAEAIEAGGDRVLVYQRAQSAARVEIGLPEVS